MEILIDVADASPNDHEWCARLMASSDPWITLGRDEAACRAALSRPGTELFVAWTRESGLPVGFILLASYGFAGSPYIATFAVSAEARGQGAGSQLLRFAEQRFRGREHLFLLVSSFNRHAQEFYRRQGYDQVGELKDYCVAGHSELILHKALA
jgi:ribosomal protein S18 acetylase RimI-like enzyme